MPLQIAFEFERITHRPQARPAKRSLLVLWWMCSVVILFPSEKSTLKMRRGYSWRILRPLELRTRIEVESPWDLKLRTTLEKLSLEKTSRSKSNTSETSQYPQYPSSPANQRSREPEKWYSQISSSRKKWSRQKC